MIKRPLYEFELEHLFSYEIRFRADPEVIGQAPEGIRVNVYFAGGAVEGPRVSGKFRPVGAARMLLRHDGIAILESRATIETDDGALIEVDHRGLLEVGEGGVEKALRSEWPERIILRGAPRYSSPHRRYAWLNRLQCLSIGDIQPTRDAAVSADVYAIT